MKTFKNIILKTITLISAVTVMACGDNEGPATPALENGPGDFSLQMTARNNFIVMGSDRTKAEIDDNIEVKDFTVVVKDATGTTAKEWDKFSQVEPVVTLEGGTYILEAYYGDMIDEKGKSVNAAWNKPYYYGKKEFRVMPQATATVEIECQLANVKASVYFTERFIAEVEPGAIVTISNNQPDPAKAGVLTWNLDTKEDGYFKMIEDHLKLTVSVTAVSLKTGEAITMSAEIDEAKARQWHKITIDMAPKSGGALASLTINNELIEQEHEIEVPDDNDIIDNNGDEGIWPDTPGGGGNAPSIEGKNLNGKPFDIAQPVIFSKADESAKILDVVMSSYGEGGIQNLFLEIKSNNPMLGGIFTSVMDLANPEAGSEWASLFLDPTIGILDPNVPIKGKTEHLFSVGGLMGMLGGISAAGDSHQFIIKVVDAEGTTSATLTINYTE